MLDCIKELGEQLPQADRLTVVTQRVGFAIWQIQELENVAVTYFVLAAQATKGMGLAAGTALEDKAKKKTFGATIHRMVEAGLLTLALEERFRKLLSERNWLVHRSRATSRSAIHRQSGMKRLVARIDAMSDEALELIRDVGELAESYVKMHGVSEQYITETAERLLAQWHAEDGI